MTDNITVALEKVREALEHFDYFLALDNPYLGVEQTRIMHGIEARRAALAALATIEARIRSLEAERDQARDAWQAANFHLEDLTRLDHLHPERNGTIPRLRAELAEAREALASLLPFAESLADALDASNRPESSYSTRDALTFTQARAALSHQGESSMTAYAEERDIETTTCAMCGAQRPFSEMGRHHTRGGTTIAFCHPALATGTTCYMHSQAALSHQGEPTIECPTCGGDRGLRVYLADVGHQCDDPWHTPGHPVEEGT